jgi:hypothetical protein
VDISKLVSGLLFFPFAIYLETETVVSFRIVPSIDLCFARAGYLETSSSFPLQKNLFAKLEQHQKPAFLFQFQRRDTLSHATFGTPTWFYSKNQRLSERGDMHLQSPPRAKRCCCATAGSGRRASFASMAYIESKNITIYIARLLVAARMIHADGCGKKRLRDDEEDEMLMMVIAYNDHVARVQAEIASIKAVCEGIIHGYVKMRGGLQEIRVFQIVPGRYNPDAICEKKFVQDFRFTHAQMDRFVLALMSAGIPSVVKTKARDKCALHEALAMMCMKYSWPKRLGDMVKIFHSSTSRISRVIGSLRRMLFDMFVPALQFPLPLSAAELERFSETVCRKSGFEGIFGFIDGTVRPIPKPTHLQSAVYNGKDRVHALKYQALVTPDGMFRQLCGPWPGSRHDMHMLSKSHLKTYIASLPKRQDGACYSVYADQGYAESVGIITPYFDGAVNAWHEICNQTMASSRIAVEWAFGDIVVYWASLDMKRQQQLLSNRKIAQVYLVAGFLCNCMNCFDRNKASRYFDVAPPALEEYIASLQRAA